MKTIMLTNGQAVLVDDDILQHIYCNEWYASKSGNNYYARRRKGRLLVYLHREIMQTPRGYRVRFINRNTLDCRRDNMANVKM